MKAVISILYVGVTLLCLGTGVPASADDHIPPATISSGDVDCSAPAMSHDEAAFPTESAELFQQGIYALLGACAEKSPEKALAAFMITREQYVLPLVSFHIGYMLENGLGTTKDTEAASAWYRVYSLEWIVQGQSQRAAYLAVALGLLGLEKPLPLLIAALDWAEELQAASPEHQLEVSRKMLTVDGQPQDIRGSLIVLKWATEQDYSEALYEMGNRHAQRTLPPEVLVNFPDHKFHSAFFWSLAARAGNSTSQMIMGKLCEERLSVWSKIDAYLWYEKAKYSGATGAKEAMIRVSKKFSSDGWAWVNSDRQDASWPAACLPE